jgi:hypothetical protein
MDLSKTMMERTELQEIGKAIYGQHSDDDLPCRFSELSSDQKARVIYCDLIIALCETVWVAHKKRWLPRDEWPYWRAWAHLLTASPDFRWALKWAKAGESYAKRFLQEIEKTD